MSIDKKNNVLREEKQKKLDKLLQKGMNPFPHQFKRTHLSSLVQKQYESLQAGEFAEKEIQIAGRLMLMRDMGKASFFNIQDPEGSQQCYVKTKELDAKSLDFFSLVDIGDIIGVQGFPFKTRTGELTIRCKNFQILCKTLEPLPEKYHGLEDKELKYRYRYLDFIMNPESKKVFFIRSQVIREIRSFMDQKGFMEVDTPTLQPLYGGALAQPFSTHHRALNCDLFLKISPELYLKRLIVGGFEKVYELSKNFRNEGVDRLHNPEFMMLEYYEAYTDYLDQMKQFEELICHVAKKVKGSLQFSYRGRPLDLTPPWKRLTLFEGIQKYGDFSVEGKSQKELFQKIQSLGPENKTTVLESKSSRGEMLMELFKLLVEKHLWDPVFIMDFPEDVSPLTKKHRETPDLVERFEPYVAGMEIGNAYTELNRPDEQRKRLQEQEKQRIENVDQPMDHDFAKAIDVGMPPTGGVGLGVERLILLLADQASLRDIILFPSLKPQLE